MQQQVKLYVTFNGEMVARGDTKTEMVHLRPSAFPASTSLAVYCRNLTRNLSAPGLDKALPAWWLTVYILIAHAFAIGGRLNNVLLLPGRYWVPAA